MIRPALGVSRLPDATVMTVTRTATELATGVVTIVMIHDANGMTIAASGRTFTAVATGTVTIIIHVVTVIALGMLIERRTRTQDDGGMTVDVMSVWRPDVSENGIAGTDTKSGTGSGPRKIPDPDGVLHATDVGLTQKRAKTGRTSARKRLNLLGWRRTFQRHPAAEFWAGGARMASWTASKPGRRA